MPIITSTTDINGTGSNELIVGVGSGASQTIVAGGGNDAVIANHAPVILENIASPLNNSFATARNLDDAENWATGSNPMVANAAVPYTTILGLGRGQNDWFKLTLNAGQTITVDVDFANSQYGTPWDSQLQLLNVSGTVIATSDDGTPDQGGLGSFRYDPGVNATRDSYLTYTASVTQTVYINLGQFGGTAPTTIPTDSTYLLNISATGHLATGAVLQNDFNAIDGGDGNDFLVGGDGGDSITGGIGDDFLYGMGADDSLEGGEGTDYLDGGAGFNRASYEHAASGVTVSLSLPGQQGVGGGEGFDTLVNIQALTGSNHNDMLTGDASANYLRGLAGSDTLLGRGGNDVFEVLDGTGSDNIDGGTEYDTVDLSNATIGWLFDFGGGGFTNGTDTLGLTNIEAIGGSTGNDTIYAPAGTILDFYGNDGDDVYYSSAVENASFDGGDGIDRLDFTHVAFANSYAADLEVGFDSYGLIISNIENISTGGTTTDELYGNDQDNVFRSGANDDILYGRGGNDVLEGGAANDSLDGGDGFDWASYESAGAGVTVTLATTAQQNTVGAGMDALNFIEALKGSVWDDTLTGNALDNWFEAKAGSDTVNGGEGNDTFFWEQFGGNDIFDGGGGTGDILYLLRADSGWTVDLATGIAGNGLSGSVALSNVEQVYGSDYADDLTANSGGGSTLYGFGGDDVIRISNNLPNTAFGGEGVDTLDTTSVIGVGLSYVIDLAAGTTNFGETVAEFENLVSGETNDFVTGTAGANIIETQSGNDTVDGGLGDDVLNGGAGIDTLSYSSATGVVMVSLALAGIQATGGAGNDQVAGFENLDGSAFADRLIGSDAANRIDGAAGADRMEGGKGDDTYIVNDEAELIVEVAGKGNDSVFSSANYTLAPNLENLTLTGSAGIAGAGNDRNNFITGNSGANVLSGREGDDRLDGGLGGDTLKGGIGNDVFVVDDAGDMVQEKVGEGIDLVESSITYTLTNDVELLRLTGSSGINGTGNTLANTLYGNNGANRLDGAGGADRAEGGNGDDVYVVNDAGDRTIEGAGKGNDSVESSVGFTLEANVENLTLTGSSNIGGAGNELNNRITGNSGSNTLGGGDGNDRLDGGTGADTLKGGLGDDVFVVDNALDIVQEKVGEGTDTVETTVTHSLSSNVEVLKLMGSNAIDGSGNELANTIVGNSGANNLHGGLGSDKITGGAGADNFWFETALGASNIDQITDFNVPADTITLDRTIFAGISANGMLAAGAFRVGAAALDADDRILYDAATGNLYYDADGVGGAAAVQFAKLDAGLSLTNADFTAVP